MPIRATVASASHPVPDIQEVCLYVRSCRKGSVGKTDPCEIAHTCDDSSPEERSTRGSRRAMPATPGGFFPPFSPAQPEQNPAQPEQNRAQSEQPWQEPGESAKKRSPNQPNAFFVKKSRTNR